MQRLIDVHTHLGWFYDSGMSADGARLCAMLRQAGITQAIAFSAEGCYGAIAPGNQYTFQEVNKHDMLRMLVVLHPYHYADSVEILNQIGDHPRVLGVKIHPHLGNYHILDRNMIRLIEEEIAPRGLPILSHVANNAPTALARDYLTLAKHFPETNFVAAHLGIGILGDAQAALNAWREMQPTNVWMDMATIRAFQNQVVEQAVSVVGSGRICFGTDAPLYIPVPFSAALNGYALSEEDRERIAWKNALDVFPRLASLESTLVASEEQLTK